MCLHEKGFISSIELLQTEDIPTSMFSSELNTEPLFSASDINLNATVLLNFLKQNCSKNNGTYLLRREEGQTNIRLYDISSISHKRQRKWIWWLANMSYRFAQKLMQFDSSVENPIRHVFRNKRRSLLETTQELLEELHDMDGTGHEIMRASVREDLADTYLYSEISKNIFGLPLKFQPYSKTNADCLTKAQDLISAAIRILQPLMRNNEDPVAFEAYGSRLYKLQMKRFDINMRLSEHYLRAYWSSSVMQSLRASSHILSALIEILRHGNIIDKTRTVGQIRVSWHCPFFLSPFLT